jgi:hypothetical protein
LQTLSLSWREICSATGAEDFNLYSDLIWFRYVKFCISYLHKITAKFPVLYTVAKRPSAAWVHITGFLVPYLIKHLFKQNSSDEIK